MCQLASFVVLAMGVLEALSCRSQGMLARVKTGRTVVGAVVAYCCVAVLWSILADLPAGESARFGLMVRLLLLGFVVVGGWALFQGSLVVRWLFVVGLLLLPAAWIALGEKWRTETTIVLFLHMLLSACLAAIPAVSVFLEEQRARLQR